MFNVEPFLDKHGIKLFWAVMITGVIPIFFYDTEFNEPYYVAFQYASLPVLAISYFIGFYFMPGWKSRSGTGIKILVPFLSAAFVILFMGGHLMAINALIGNQKEVMIGGKIVDMSISRGRSLVTYKAKVKVNNTDKIKKLEITGNEYKSYKVGDTYQKTWLRGSLGFIYRKK